MPHGARFTLRSRIHLSGAPYAHCPRGKSGHSSRYRHQFFVERATGDDDPYAHEKTLTGMRFLTGGHFQASGAVSRRKSFSLGKMPQAKH